MNLRFQLSLAAGLLLATQASLLAVGDGPRAYMLAPADSQILTAYGLFLDGNQNLDPGVSSRNLDLDVDVGVLQYTHSFSLFDNACGAFLIAPFGSTEGTCNFPRSSPCTTAIGASGTASTPSAPYWRKTSRPPAGA